MKKITLVLLLFCVSLFAQEDNYSVKNIDVNTEYSDFGVAYLGDSTAIYASTRKDKNSIRKRVWQQNRQPYLELYSGVLTLEGEIIESENFSKKINTKYHEASVSFTKDLKTVYFSADNYNEDKKLKRASEGKDKGWVLIQLYKATVEDNGEWSNITPMPFNSNEYQTGDPSLNDAEDKLYFTSDMPGGYGITDIYIVEINTDGTYGEPKNLGPNVNTAESERFPFISNENVLYYSSNGRENSFGELDIYATKTGIDGNYIEPVNLGEPLNSNKDDFALVYQGGKKTGHFSSNRDGGKGDDDIYFFEELKPIFEEVVICNQIVKGVVRDKNSGALLPNATVTLFKDGNKGESVVVGSDAVFSFKVDCESSYNILGEKITYSPDNENFVTTEENNLELSLDLNLEDREEFISASEKVLVNINPIYFDLNSSYIREDAERELNKVVEIMQKHPSIVIECGSHTDSRASDDYNDWLSDKRAKSSVKWIIENGISSSRIYGKGYGETKLINKCSDEVKCTEEEHQLNRRTEFVIINPKVINK